MRIKLDNGTGWRSDDLRGILRAAAEAVGVRQDKRVVVRTRRRSMLSDLHVTGRAVIGSRAHEGNWVTLNVPTPKQCRESVGYHMDVVAAAFRVFEDPPDADSFPHYLGKFPQKAHAIADAILRLPVEVYAVACHEFMHNLGVEHGDMTKEQYLCRPREGDVPEGLVLRAVAPKPKPTAEERRQALVLKRAAHAELMLQKAVTRRKRAQTLERKWLQKARYYRRVLEERGLDENLPVAAKKRPAR